MSWYWHTNRSQDFFGDLCSLEPTLNSKEYRQVKYQGIKSEIENDTFSH